jgi:Clr5 domain
MSSLVSACGPTDYEWDFYEGTIRSLYLVENRKLEGLGGVIDEMAKKHQFVAR